MLPCPHVVNSLTYNYLTQSSMNSRHCDQHATENFNRDLSTNLRSCQPFLQPRYTTSRTDLLRMWSAQPSEDTAMAMYAARRTIGSALCNDGFTCRICAHANTDLLTVRLILLLTTIIYLQWYTNNRYREVTTDRLYYFFGHLGL